MSSLHKHNFVQRVELAECACFERGGTIYERQKMCLAESHNVVEKASTHQYVVLLSENRYPQCAELFSVS